MKARIIYEVQRHFRALTPEERYYPEARPPERFYSLARALRYVDSRRASHDDLRFEVIAIDPVLHLQRRVAVIEPYRPRPSVWTPWTPSPSERKPA